MEEEIILGRDLVGEALKQFLTQYDAPAYIRRARAVEAAWQQLLTRLRLQREEWLKMPRTYLGILRALSVQWSHLLPLLEDAEQIGMLQKNGPRNKTGPAQPNRANFISTHAGTSLTGAARKSG